jgi:Acetyltransferases, including N-acetylases of ribosomal proteins
MRKTKGRKMEFKLRKWELGDVESLTQHANNINIACCLRNIFPNPYTVVDAKEYIDYILENGDNRQINYAITVDNKAVGGISISLGTDIYCKKGEVGYWLSENYWGKGIITKATRIICEEAFHKFDIVRIESEVFSHNIGSRRVLEKNGFNLEGTMKNSVCKNGIIYDSCMYAILKNRFVSGK